MRREWSEEELETLYDFFDTRKPNAENARRCREIILEKHGVDRSINSILSACRMKSKLTIKVWAGHWTFKGKLIKKKEPTYHWLWKTEYN